MRFLFLLLICLQSKAQQTFIELDSLSAFPQKTHDSLSRYPLILLGEMHGTKEAPMVVKSLVDLFSKHKKVIIALEIPDVNQKIIDRYLQTGNEKFLDQIAFFKETRDGRSSEAMATLIKNSYGKKNVSIFCFDITTSKDVAGYRDSMMARSLVTHQKQNSGAVIILLSGNIHSNLKKGFREGYETMGYYLKEIYGKDLISLNIRYNKGTAYNCMNGACKEREMETDTSQFKNYLRKEAYILIDKAFEETGINGIIYLREISASRPFISN